jgi:chitodextrinase
MRYTYPAGSGTDYTTSRSLDMPNGDQSEVWVEAVVRWSPDFTIQGNGQGSGPAQKLLHIGISGGSAGRFGLNLEQDSIRAEGPNDDYDDLYTPGDATVDELFDGEWHTLRYHVRLGATDFHEFWVDGEYQGSNTGQTAASSLWDVSLAKNLNMLSDHSMQMWWGQVKIWEQDPNWSDTDTTPSDTTAPTRSSGSPTNTLAAGTTSTTLSLTTNESATCRFSTTSGKSYSAMSNTFSTTGGTSHSTTISSLTAGTHTYYIRCSDAAGNANTSDYSISFSVAAEEEGSDTTAPTTPTHLTASNITTSAVTLSWTASTDAVGVDHYQIYRNSTQIDTTSSTSYTDTGLSDDTSYTYTVRAVDAAGNISSESSSKVVTTDSDTPAGGGGGGSSNNDNNNNTSSNTGGSSSSGSSSHASGGGGSSSNTAAVPHFTTDLSPGHRGPLVTDLQNFLTEHGYLASGNATGYFGPLTTQALQNFQRAQGIVTSGTPATTGFGNFGPQTRRAVNSLLGSTSSGTEANQALIESLQKQIAELTKQVNELIAQWMEMVGR